MKKCKIVQRLQRPRAASTAASQSWLPLRCALASPLPEFLDTAICRGTQTIRAAPVREELLLVLPRSCSRTVLFFGGSCGHRQAVAISVQ